jgi:hypothetical protein
MRRRRVLCLLRGTAASAVLVALASTAQADSVAKLVDALNASRSFKVRVQAASLLARLRDPRASEALVGASASDPEPVVRSLALKLLSKSALSERMAVQTARQACGRAQRDSDASVRRHAAACLSELDHAVPAAPRLVTRPAPRNAVTTVAIGAIGDRTGRASRVLRERMRAQMLSLLGREPRVTIGDASGEVSFLVDGTISKLSLSLGGPDVEAVCAIELVVSRPPRGIVTVASGEASVQKPRAHYQPILRDRMELEAMENAVRSAHENLARFLAAQ